MVASFAEVKIARGCFGNNSADDRIINALIVESRFSTRIDVFEDDLHSGDGDT
jgi:hypothetical protein